MSYDTDSARPWLVKRNRQLLRTPPAKPDRLGRERGELSCQRSPVHAAKREDCTLPGV